ncbi:major facilitator superfamily domain-containing protein [Microdochium trichocladiopsis]|uniref:Major facilitator superfamily domain-containing protein n=1 Tax=Microdochium trichocladiopsis TaxID=1682393 RepID=A0A9P8Y5L4_9PEZI|nr:major facilitator superfamily domain-containing protein [Microdochium trichocladiopsis]KAH7029794.1 major facilitator superfamily domain-containing protein [Microdochium trichocladiopsis]
MEKPDAAQKQPPEILRGLSGEEMEILNKKLVRKLDLRLMAPLIVMYIMNYLDRNAIGAAKISGIVPDLGLSDSQFQVCVSILFVGSYILMQIPSNLFLNKIGKPAMYLPACMIVWGAVCACTGAVHNFSGLAATRFLLGFVEAAYFPGCMLCLSVWYTRKELALRTALLYCGSLFSGAFSGLIAAGITSSLEGAMGLKSWRWLFIIEGAVTVALALVVSPILPDFPHNTKWLSEQERALAMWRQTSDIGEEDHDSSESSGMFDAFFLCIRDYRTWLFFFVILGVVSSGTINSYFPSVVQTLGYGRTQTLLLTAPPYLLSCVVNLAISWHSDKTGERYFHFTVPVWFSVAGFIISAATTNLGARYFSMMIMLPGVYTAFTIGLTWLANSLPRPPAKRAAALALCSGGSNVSSIYAPFLYPESTAPRYLLAMGVNAATAFLSIIVATAVRIVLVRLNRKLDIEEFGSVEAAQEHRKRGPLTSSGEAAPKSFRYMY